MAGISLFQVFDIDLAPLHHGLHHSRRLLRIRITNIFPKAVGMICHHKPYLSFSHPHRLFSPLAESFSHSSSTACCVSQFTKREIASVNLNFGPPFSAMNSCPSS